MLLDRWEGKIELNHQVFTPEKVVQKMLNLASFDNELIGKKILESAFGEGNILIDVVKKYIKEGQRKGYSNDFIANLLERDIYGIEIDNHYYYKCLNQLNKVLRVYDIPAVKWNLYRTNALTLDWDIKFDLIIGNPPYIKYHNIKQDERKLLRKTFQSCKVGSFDYYYAFLENDYNFLSPTGKLIYLIPNNVFKNVFAENLRKLIKDDLKAVYDFTSAKVFNGILTTSAIILIDKGDKSDKFTYFDVQNESSVELEKKNMMGKWVFKNLTNISKENMIFGDLFKAQMGVATLLNKAFILQDFKEHNDYYVKHNHMIEKGIVRNAVSPRSLFYGHMNKIIFPYKMGEKVKRYSDEEFNDLFPLGKKYLCNFINELNSRRVNSNTKWFEYGRSQALNTISKERLLVSTLITKEMKVYRIKPNDVIYSGISIHAKDNNDLEVAKYILESDEFFLYVKNIGVNTNSKSLRISARDINDFPVSNYIKKESFNEF